jgi:hypothetical protein
MILDTGVVPRFLDLTVHQVKSRVTTFNASVPILQSTFEKIRSSSLPQLMGRLVHWVAKV